MPTTSDSAKSTVVSPLRLKFERLACQDLSETHWREIVELCLAAYEEDFEAIFRTLPRTKHILARVDGRLVSHACWATRWLQPGDHSPLRTAFVEAVATAPNEQRRGYASAVMRRLAREILEYDLGGLSPACPHIYERLGWQMWRGPLAIRTDNGLLSTPRDDVMVLRLPRTPELDLAGPLSAEWREGELW